MPHPVCSASLSIILQKQTATTNSRATDSTATVMRTRAIWRWIIFDEDLMRMVIPAGMASKSSSSL